MDKWIMWDVTNDCTKIWHWHWSDVDRTWSKAESKTTRINAALFHVVIFFGRFVGNLFLPKNFRTKVNFELRRVGQSATDWVASGPPNGHLSVCCRRRGGPRAVYLSPLKGETKNVVDLSAADPRSVQEYQEERKVVGRWRRKRNK